MYVRWILLEIIFSAGIFVCGVNNLSANRQIRQYTDPIDLFIY